jgi:hypothetical protein
MGTRKPKKSETRIRYSFCPVPRALIRHSNISSGAIKLWCVLDDLAWRNIPPEIETLRLETGASRRTIFRWLQELEASGYLIWERGRWTQRFTLLNGQRADADADANADALARIRKAIDNGGSLAEIAAIVSATSGTEEKIVSATSGTESATSGTESATSGTEKATPSHQKEADFTPETHGDSFETQHETSSSADDESDDDETVVFLKSMSISAASEFRGLDLDAVRERAEEFGLFDSPKNRGAFVKSLRENPPQPEDLAARRGFVDWGKYDGLFSNTKGGNDEG